MILKTKLLLAFCLSAGLGVGNQVVDTITPQEQQPNLWEIAIHPDCNVVKTVKHRYTGQYADPMEIYFVKDNAGNISGFKWGSDVIDVPLADRSGEAPWKCIYENSGFTLVNIFNDETISSSDMTIAQSSITGEIICYGQHEADGQIVALTHSPW